MQRYYTAVKPMTFILCLVLSGCRLVAADTSITPMPTLPSVRIALQASPTPAPTRELRTVAISTPTSTPEPVLVYDCEEAAADSYRSHYQVVANVNYETKVVDVAETIHYRNESGEPLTDLVMAVPANAIAGQFQAGTIRFNEVELQTVLEANRWWIPLPVALEDGCTASLDITFRLRLPRIGAGTSAVQGYLAYNERQFNLGHWLPAVAPRHDGLWIVHDTAAIGEQFVLEQALWDVTLNVAQAPTGLVVALPGEVSQTADAQWHSIFAGGRDFTVSMSPDFRVLKQQAVSGTEIELYVLPDAIRPVDNVLLDGGQHVLTETVKAFQQYEALFGAYPYRRLAIVQGDFADGMEFSGLVFVSTSWYYSFKGGYQNYLTLIAVHEVSHQWWYAQVGNDAALVPWLDEALATYSEYVYYEEFHPELKDWWWSARVAYYNPQGKVDSTVYDFSNGRDYINAVYLRGVQMLQNVRDDIGTEAFFDLLATYARRGSGQLATSALFWSLLSADQWQATQATREEFFSDANDGRP